MQLVRLFNLVENTKIPAYISDNFSKNRALRSAPYPYCSVKSQPLHVVNDYFPSTMLSPLPLFNLEVKMP